MPRASHHLRVQYIHAVLRRAIVTAARVTRHEVTQLTLEQARQLIDATAADRRLARSITALGTGVDLAARRLRGPLRPRQRRWDADLREDVKNLLGHSTIVLTSNICGHGVEPRQQEVARAMDAVLVG